MGSGEEDNLDEDCSRSEHEGVKYPCNQCDYQATTEGHLQSHILVKHRETVLKCDDGMGDGEKEVLDKIDFLNFSSSRSLATLACTCAPP